MFWRVSTFPLCHTFKHVTHWQAQFLPEQGQVWTGSHTDLGSSWNPKASCPEGQVDDKVASVVLSSTGIQYCHLRGPTGLPCDLEKRVIAHGPIHSHRVRPLLLRWHSFIHALKLLKKMHWQFPVNTSRSLPSPCFFNKKKWLGKSKIHLSQVGTAHI